MRSDSSKGLRIVVVRSARTTAIPNRCIAFLNERHSCTIRCDIPLSNKGCDGIQASFPKRPVDVVLESWALHLWPSQTTRYAFPRILAGRFERFWSGYFEERERITEHQVSALVGDPKILLRHSTCATRTAWVARRGVVFSLRYRSDPRASRPTS